MVQKDKVQLNPQEKEALYEELRSMGGRNEAVIRQHAEAGLSMYGSDPRFPGKIVELAPDGKYFIVRRKGDGWVRVREVSV